MKRYLSNQLTFSFKTYLWLMLASATSVLLIDFFLRASDFAQHSFKSSISDSPELALLISPLIFLLIVIITKNYCHFVQGSGIPQAIAATQSNNKLIRDKLLSFRVAIGKIIFIFFGMLGGGSIGIEGPSIHIGSSIFYGFNLFIKQKRKLFLHAIIAIGGSAGLIVAFNAPIAGFLFAYEELGRNLKRQLFFLVGLFSLLTYFFSYLYRGNDFYLVDLTNLSTDFLMVWILFPLVLVSGVLGGVI
ncbi:MAG: chloride channel protein [Gammaproteobacteria bacterium]